jgi:DinB superfamily
MLEIEHKEPPADCETGGPNPAKTKAEIVQYLRQSFARLDSAVDGLTPANALDPAGGRYGGQSTRLGLITLAVWHGADHYGQGVSPHERNCSARESVIGKRKRKKGRAKGPPTLRSIC